MLTPQEKLKVMVNSCGSKKINSEAKVRKIR